MLLRRTSRWGLAALLLASLASHSFAQNTPQATEWFGRVVAQSDLEPLANVRVRVEPVPEGGLLAEIAPVENPNADAPVVTTTANGGFAINAPANRRLRLSAPGFLDGFVLLHENRDNDLGRLVLRHELSFSGRVLIEGRPAEGTTIVAPVYQIARGVASPFPLRATSDGRGRFELSGLRAERLTELVFVHGGVAQSLDLGSASHPLDPRRYDLGDIELVPSREIVGRVAGPGGEPVIDATVWLSRSSSMRLRSRARDDQAAETLIPWMEAGTNAAGRFALSVLPGEHQVEVFSPTQGRVTVELTVDGTDETQTFDTIVLPGTVARGGRVVDAAGVPLAGVAVTLASVDSWPALVDSDPAMRGATYRVRTDVSGCFTLPGLPTDDGIWIVAEHNGFVRSRVRREAETLEDDAAQPACGSFGDIVLQPGGVIEGTVVDETGSPIAGVDILPRHHQTPNVAHGVPPPRFVTDESGRFRIDDAKLGVYDVRAAAPGYASTSVRDILLEPSGGATRATPRIVMPGIRELAPLEVVVFDPRGAPEPSADVSVTRNAGGPPTALLRYQQTGADGRAVYPAAPVGVYSVTADARGSRNHSYWQGPYRVQGDATTVVIEMSPVPAPFVSLSGRFVDGEGRGIPRALIHAAGAVRPFNDSQAITEADGSFRFDRVPAGRYLLRATAAGFPDVIHRSALDVEPPGLDNVLVRVPALGGITGSVTGLRDEEVEYLRVNAYTEEEREDRVQQSVGVSGEVDEQGNFRVDGLIPGEWRVQASVSGGRYASTMVSLDEAGTVAGVIVSLASGFTLTGRVVWREAPPETGRIELTGVTVRHSRSALFDPRQRFELHDLPAGEYRVTVGDDPSLRSAFRTFIEVRTDTETEIVIRGAAVAGRAVDADTGEPIGGASFSSEPVLLSPCCGAVRRTDRDGTFAVGPFGAGLRRFEFSAPGYASRSTVLEIEDVDIDDLTIAMRRTPGLRLRFETPDGTLPEIISLAWYDLEHGEGFQNSAFPEMQDTMEFHWLAAGAGRGVLYASNGDLRLAARMVIDNDGEPVTVELRGAGRLFVDVPDLPLGERGAALRLFDGAGLPVTNRGGGIERTRRLEGGFRITRLPPDTYRIVVTTENGRTWTGEAEVRAFEATEVVLR